MYNSHGNEKLTINQKLELGLRVHNKNTARIKENYTGKVILHFLDGEIIFYEPNYKEKLRKTK